MQPLFDAPVLILDDDEEFCAEIARYLEGFHIPVRVTHRPQDAEAVLRDTAVSMLLLDVMLPEQHGFDFCKSLRARRPGLPILFVSAYCDSFEQVLSFEAGGDQFLAKPFLPQELLARMKALMRRAGPQSTAVPPAPRPAEAPGPGLAPGLAQVLHTREGLVADLRRASVTLDGQPLHLTPFQFELLAHFLRRPGQLVTREEIMTEVQTYAAALDSRSVDINVSRLRRALGDAPEAPRFIRTVWRKGYVFIDEPLPCAR